MEKKINNTNDSKKIQNCRVFARQVSYQISEEELKQIAGGNNANLKCTRTKYPTADVDCNL